MIFSIHFLNTYTTQITSNKRTTHIKALRTTYFKTSKGIIMGAITTTAVFLSLLLMEMEALKIMGIVSAIYIMCQAINTFTFLPCLLYVREHYVTKYHPKKNKKFLKDLNLHYQFFTKCWLFLNQHPKTGIFACFLLTAILSTGIFFLKPVTNPMQSYTQRFESIQLQQKMVDSFGLAPRWTCY